MGRIARYQADILMNMTYYLCKDATIKLWHADRVQQRYLGTLSYELGVITASIQDIFRRMLNTYRKYSNLTNFRFGQYYAEEIISAYHIVKGDFNALKMQRTMFMDVLNAHYERMKMPPTTRSRGRRIRGPRGRRAGHPSLRDPEYVYKNMMKYQHWTDAREYAREMGLSDLE
ncbi:unnamed protein product [Chilo suppressalis]|nr:unnamed protein product [Chilo suppressalis]